VSVSNGDLAEVLAPACQPRVGLRGLIERESLVDDRFDSTGGDCPDSIAQIRNRSGIVTLHIQRLDYDRQQIHLATGTAHKTNHKQRPAVRRSIHRPPEGFRTDRFQYQVRAATLRQGEYFLVPCRGAPIVDCQVRAQPLSTLELFLRGGDENDSRTCRLDTGAPYAAMA
jgi:hypothetical protein